MRLILPLPRFRFKPVPIRVAFPRSGKRSGSQLVPLMSMRPFLLLHLLLGLLLAHTASATVHPGCTRPNPTKLNAEAYSAAAIPFGHVNLSSPDLQPPGSHLASVLVPSTNYIHNGVSGDDVLWLCDKKAVDDGKVYFLVSVNGDSRFGGEHKIGTEDGLDDVHATWFDYIGLRLSMAGVTLTQYWKKVPLDTYSVMIDKTGKKEKEKVEIRLRDIPPMQAELYRVSRPVPAGGGVPNCAHWMPRIPGEAGTSYECEEPSGYLQLVGPGLPHDEEGEYHKHHYDFWTTNGIGYGLRRALFLTNSATCAARSTATHVVFPTLSAKALQAGDEAPAHFSIEVECSDGAQPGTGSRQTAIGLQVSPDAFYTARTLGLTNAQGGVYFLVSDHYDTDPAIAKGVGIVLERRGEPQRFLSPDFSGNEPGKGEMAGWYPVTHDSEQIDLTTIPDGIRRLYRLDFNAWLTALPGQQVTPGKVRAHANIVIRMQ